MKSDINREQYGLKQGDIVYLAEQNFNDSRVHTLKKGTISSLGKSGLAFVVELSSTFHPEDGSEPTTIARKPLELFTAKQIMDIVFVPELNQRPKMSAEAFIDEHMSDSSLAFIVTSESIRRLRAEMSATA